MAPSASTIRALVEALPEGATLTATVNGGRPVTTNSPGPLTLRTG